MTLHGLAALPETVPQWIATAALPALVFAGTVAVLCWARYLAALNRLDLSPARTAPGVRARAEEDFAMAYRYSVWVVVVMTVGLGALGAERLL